MIAAQLHQKTKIPWVADFRDPMAQDGYPADPLTKQNYLQIEEQAAQLASFCVFTTPGAARDYQQRYPSAAQRMVVIENGYDEESFASASALAPAVQTQPPGSRPLVLLHSGIVYPSERDPTQLFMALGQLKSQQLLGPHELRIRFRASFHDDLLRTLSAQHGAQDFLELCPAIPYREALAEMMQVDALLVMQASNCNAQIPAKIYEYLRAGRPILGLTDPQGDTAGVLREAGLPEAVPLDSASKIAASLQKLVNEWRCGQLTLPNLLAVQMASRAGRSKSFAQLLAQVAKRS